MALTIEGKTLGEIVVLILFALLKFLVRFDQLLDYLNIRGR